LHRNNRLNENLFERIFANVIMDVVNMLEDIGIVS